MRVLGQPAALIAAATMLLLLATLHPIMWLQARNTATTAEQQQQPDPASQYVAMLSQSKPLRAALRDRQVIGYVSAGDIDVRSDGSGQARYYLTQFALAPVLVELKSVRGQHAPDPDLVFAAFRHPEQLGKYLSDHSRIAIVSLNASIALTRARTP